MHPDESGTFAASIFEAAKINVVNRRITNIKILIL